MIVSPFSIRVPVSNFQVPCIGSVLVSAFCCDCWLQETIISSNKAIDIFMKIVFAKIRVRELKLTARAWRCDDIPFYFFSVPFET